MLRKEYQGSFTKQVSTVVVCNSGNVNVYDLLQIRADNFIDEDGKPSSLWDVLEGLLKPLALRIEQRVGRIFIYDYNAISANSATPIVWASDDQMLAIDETYNKVIVTLSTYAESKIMNNETVNFEFATGQGGTNYQIDTNFNTDPNADREVSFTYRVGNASVFPSQLQTLNRPIIKIEGSQNITAIAAYVANIGAQNLEDNEQLPSGSRNYSGSVPQTRSKATIYKTTPVFIAPTQTYMLIEVPMMFDGRYCPFADEGDYNRQGSRIKTRGNAIYLNCRIKCGDYYLINNPRYNTDRYAYVSAANGGAWLQRTPQDNYDNNNEAGCICSLMYYVVEDNYVNTEDCGALGWSTNKQTNGNRNTLDQQMRKGRAGLYCPAPPVAGELTIEVLDDLVIMDGGVGYDVANTQTDVYKQCRWWLIGIPSVKLVKFNKTGTDLDDVKIDDIEESGIINADAKEELTS